MLAALLFLAPIVTGNITVYADDLPVDVPYTLEKTPLSGDKALYALTARLGALETVAVGEVEAAIEGLVTGCTQTIDASTPRLGAKDEGLTARVTITYTQYFCSDWTGKRQLFVEKGAIDARVTPIVADGVPSFVLSEFNVTGLSRAASILQIDVLLQTAAERELRKVSTSKDLQNAVTALKERGAVLTDMAFADVEGLFATGVFSAADDDAAFREILNDALNGDL